MLDLHTLTPTERLTILALRLRSPQTFAELIDSTGTGSPASMRTALRVLNVRQLIARDGKDITLTGGAA